MMRIIKYPDRNDWNKLLQRNPVDINPVFADVKNILDKVRQSGDQEIKNFTKRFDKAGVDELAVSEKEFREAETKLPEDLKQAIQAASKNIKKCHKEQLTRPGIIETMPGVKCWRRSVPIERVGLYIPGGTAPLFSTLLMLGIPALLAGCGKIIVCSPPDKNGNIAPSILYTASYLGLDTVFKIGGAQAIAAMAYGTESVPRVYKIFGPGNKYVTAAKQLVQVDGVAIDLPAGPSELAIYADESADPRFIAADLLSQAEHGEDSQILFVTNAGFLVDDVLASIKEQLADLPRKEIAAAALANSKCILVKTSREAIELINEFAPEHLILACSNATVAGGAVINAGSVFIGHYSPETVGDYASGTNHTLPTNSFAKAYSGVSVDSFVKKITYQELNYEGLKNISDIVVTMAEAEGLMAHANAVRVRMETTADIGSKK